MARYQAVIGGFKVGNRGFVPGDFFEVPGDVDEKTLRQLVQRGRALPAEAAPAPPPSAGGASSVPAAGGPAPDKPSSGTGSKEGK